MPVVAEELRILHIVHQYLPEYVGGTEHYTRTLAEHQVQAGHTVSIFTPTAGISRWPEPAIEEGVRVYRLPVGPRSSRQVFFQTLYETRTHRAFADVLAREKPSLIHGQHFMGLPAIISDETVAAGIPLVITVHDYWYVCANGQLITNYDHTTCLGPQQTFLNCGRCAVVRAGYDRVQWLAPAIAPLMAYRNRLMRRMLTSASRVIFPSHFVQKIYKEMGVARDNSIVVHHGIEVPEEKPDELPERRESASGRQLRIGFVGSVAWQKGLHNLVTAVNRLPAEGIRCDIYGSLSTYPDYVRRLQEMSTHPGIHFHGQIAHELLWSKLAALDVLVLPTMWYEASPLSIQEAFATRVPMIASRIGAIEELIRDGEDGLLVPPGDVNALYDALLLLYQEPQRLASLRAAIRPVRTIDEHVANVTDVYQAILNPPVPNK
jgi:glycosyltransferase involved in cell wall biosynthesis